MRRVDCATATFPRQPVLETLAERHRPQTLPWVQAKLDALLVILQSVRPIDDAL